MSLKAKLARLSGVASLAKTRTASSGQSDTLAARGSNDAGTMPGQVKHFPTGPIRLVSHRYEHTECYGTERLSTVPNSSGASLGALGADPALAACAPSKALFIDTETTGLAGGAGTIPFLVGLSWYEGDTFHVEQALILGFGQELPMLELLRARLQAASCIVTFNGKSFDWPLLRSRFVMNRLKPPVPPHHFDLLHAVRRIVKRRLSSCRLVHLEDALLQTQRVDDIEGAEIPDAYFSFLETQRPGLMPKVIEHNRLDLLALPALLGWLIRRWRDPTLSSHGEDLMGFARLAERIGESGQALKFATRASLESSPAIRGEAHFYLAKWARQRREYDREMMHLTQVTQIDRGQWRDRAHLRLAITLEHSYKDPGAAYAHALKQGAAESQRDQARRLMRLDRRRSESRSKEPKASCPTNSYTSSTLSHRSREPMHDSG
ncbi:MAG: ribonuclease H-like domain-containing protein [Myxococcota bacterium]|nr:ribonuclease H-like domain-containing protein [Myxococcota bacterium]